MAREIAEAIATHRAAQGAATVLVHADLHRADDEAPGLAELLDVHHPADLEDVLNRSDRLEIIPAGMSSGDPAVLFDRQRISAVVEKLRERASFVVIASPALPYFAEAQVISDVTDGTLLLVEQGTRLDDAREALRVLDQVGASLIGVVLAEGDSRSSILRRATRFASAARKNGDRATGDSGHIDSQVVSAAPPPAQQIT